MGIRDYNLGENKLEQQTPIPPPPPPSQIKDEATQKPKRAIFPSGGAEGGVPNFPFILSKIVAC